MLSQTWALASVSREQNNVPSSRTTGSDLCSKTQPAAFRHGLWDPGFQHFAEKIHAQYQLSSINFVRKCQTMRWDCEKWRQNSVHVGWFLLCKRSNGGERELKRVPMLSNVSGDSLILNSPGWPWTWYIAETGLELVILLPSPSKFWDYRHVLLYPA